MMMKVGQGDGRCMHELAAYTRITRLKQIGIKYQPQLEVSVEHAMTFLPSHSLICVFFPRSHIRSVD